MTRFRSMALLTSPTEPAEAAAETLRGLYDWSPVAEAEVVVALGGDGFMLQTLHGVMERRRHLPVFGMNLGTVGFLMNGYQPDGLIDRLTNAKPFTLHPLCMEAQTVGGQRVVSPAINEVSLLRETRQAAK